MDRMLNQSVAFCEKKIKDKSDKRKLLHKICNEYIDKEKANEDQAEGPLRKQFKAQYFDDWEKELCLWKAKMNEIAQPEVEDSKILPNDYDKWLTPEQTEFVESAIDHETWLSESKNFRMMVQMVLQCQQRLNYLKSYYDRILTQIIERKVLQYFTDNYSLARIITENQK